MNKPGMIWRRPRSTACSHSPMLLEVSVSAQCLLCPCRLLMSYGCGVLLCSETCGGAPPEGTSSENVGLAEAVGFLDRVCAYASAALQKSTGALATVHQSIFPNKPSPVAVDALAAPFEGNAATKSQVILRRLSATSPVSLMARPRPLAG